MFRHYAALTQQDLPMSGNIVAVLPLAAIETHGPHLPLGTDGFIAEGILDHAQQLDRDTRDTTVLRLPLLWLGASAEHNARAGTLSRDPQSLVTSIVDIGAGLAKAGLRRILLFNGHGGNVAAAQIAALALRSRYELLAASVHWLDLGLPDTIKPPAPMASDVHGGWIETSAMLHLAPDLVKMEQAQANPPVTPAPCLFPNGPVTWGWHVQDLAEHSQPDGWIGRPDLADRDIGRALVEHAAARLCSVLHELVRADWR